MSLLNKANIITTPTAYSVGKLHSVKPENEIYADFDFARNSSATRVGENGLIQSVAANLPRINYENGIGHLLLEPQRTNLLTYSEDFSNAAWTKQNTTIIENEIISPDGYTNADAIVDTATNAEHNISRPTNIAVTASSPITQSVFLKSGTQPFAMLRNFGVGSQQYFCVVVNLNTGTITKTQAGTSTSNTSATITDYGNGWYRVTATATFATGTLNNPILHLVNSATPTIGTYGEVTYLGNGTNSIFAWGFQLENASAYATSYIPTLSAAATRIAEVCNGSGNASTFNSSEGVLMAQISALANDGTDREMTISDGTNSNRVVIGYNSSNQIVAAVLSGGVQMLQTITTDILLTKKIALKYKQNDFALWFNGFKVYTDLIGSTFSESTLNQISFNRPDTDGSVYAKTKQIQYFPEALTDSELECLTSWSSFNRMAIDLNYTIQ